jgi:hypothetical protein
VTVEEIIAEARALIAAGDEPDWKQLRDRLRALDLKDAERRRALQQLERLGAVHRARRSRRTASPVEQPPAAPLRPPLRTRATVTGNMDVRRGEGDTLTWRAEPAVVAWELRISERPDPRGDYELRESGELPGEATAIELPLGEVPLRVHLLGRNRSGRLVRRAIVSGLTRETWAERWQRRASAS